MGRIDAATRWSLGLWLTLGLAPVVISSLPWAAWKADTNLAAWVQAVGSVVAVIATGAAIVLQHALSTRQKLAEEKAKCQRRVEGARRLLAGGANILNKCSTQLLRGPSPLDLDLMVTEIGMVADVLAKVDSMDMDDWTHTEAVATGLSNARAATALLQKRVNHQALVGPVEYQFLAHQFEVMRDDMRRCEAVLARVLGYPQQTA